MRTRRLGASFDGLNSYLAQSAGELQSGTKIAAHAKFQSMSISYTGSQGVEKQNLAFAKQNYSASSK